MHERQRRDCTLCGVFGVLLSASALAQGGPPAASPPESVTPPTSTGAPARAFPPAAPQEPPGQGPPAPAPNAYPAGAYGAPPYGAAPPPAYGPQPQQWPAPAAYYPPPAEPKSEGPRSLAERGPYFGAWLGVGGPFGGDTTTRPGVGYTEGVGVLGAAGYAFIPNFGLNLFLHYNRSSLAIERDGQPALDENSGYVLLYGIEARGIVGAGPLLGWASLGVSLGSGSLAVSTTTGDSFQGTFTSRNDATVDFNPMPVLAFGAELRLAEGLSAGPQLRWYVTSASEACQELHTTGTSDPNFAGGKVCTKAFSSVSVPDIVFVGIGLSYRLALGS